MLRYLHYQEDDLLDEFGEIICTGLIWFSELEKYICFVDNDDGFALQHEFPPFVVVPDLIQQLKGDKIVVGMSRGLFCMHGLDISGTIVVWNPSIRKSVGIVDLLSLMCRIVGLILVLRFLPLLVIRGGNIRPSALKWTVWAFFSESVGANGHPKLSCGYEWTYKGLFVLME
ncbi:hypothetical protein Tco_1127741 [Tanacetum coccineum]